MSDFLRGLKAFLTEFGTSDLGATPGERWLRAVAHGFLGTVAGVASSAHPPLLPWLLALWGVVQLVQWARDGWTRRGLRDVIEDTAWTVAGLWLGAITAPRDPIVWGWSVAAMAVALVIRGALLARR